MAGWLKKQAQQLLAGELKYQTQQIETLVQSQERSHPLPQF